jgi:hypothetical protein
MGCFSSKIHPEMDRSTRELLKNEGFDFILTKKGATMDVNVLRSSSHNPAIKQCATHLCSTSGDLITMKWLQSKGADLSARNSYNQSPFLLACERGIVSRPTALHSPIIPYFNCIYILNSIQTKSHGLFH